MVSSGRGVIGAEGGTENFCVSAMGELRVEEQQTRAEMAKVSVTMWQDKGFHGKETYLGTLSLVSSWNR